MTYDELQLENLYLKRQMAEMELRRLSLLHEALLPQIAELEQKIAALKQPTDKGEPT